MTRREYYRDEAGNSVVLDHDGRLCGYNAEGEMLSIAALKALVKKSGLDITFHWAPSVESRYMARLAREMLEK